MAPIKETLSNLFKKKEPANPSGIPTEIELADRSSSSAYGGGNGYPSTPPRAYRPVPSQLGRDPLFQPIAPRGTRSPSHRKVSIPEGPAEIPEEEIGVKFPSLSYGPGIERRVFFDPSFTPKSQAKAAADTPCQSIESAASMPNPSGEGPSKAGVEELNKLTVEEMQQTDSENTHFAYDNGDARTQNYETNALEYPISPSYRHHHRRDSSMNALLYEFDQETRFAGSEELQDCLSSRNLRGLDLAVSASQQNGDFSDVSAINSNLFSQHPSAQSDHTCDMEEVPLDTTESGTSLQNNVSNPGAAEIDQAEFEQWILDYGSAFLDSSNDVGTQASRWSDGTGIRPSYVDDEETPPGSEDADASSSSFKGNSIVSSARPEVRQHAWTGINSSAAVIDHMSHPEHSNSDQQGLHRVSSLPNTAFEAGRQSRPHQSYCSAPQQIHAWQNSNSWAQRPDLEHLSEKETSVMQSNHDERNANTLDSDESQFGSSDDKDYQYETYHTHFHGNSHDKPRVPVEGGDLEEIDRGRAQTSQPVRLRTRSPTPPGLFGRKKMFTDAPFGSTRYDQNNNGLEDDGRTRGNTDVVESQPKTLGKLVVPGVFGGKCNKSGVLRKGWSMEPDSSSTSPSKEDEFEHGTGSSRPSAVPPIHPRYRGNPATHNPGQASSSLSHSSLSHSSFSQSSAQLEDINLQSGDRGDDMKDTINASNTAGITYRNPKPLLFQHPNPFTTASLSPTTQASSQQISFEDEENACKPPLTKGYRQRRKHHASILRESEDSRVSSAWLSTVQEGASERSPSPRGSFGEVSRLGAGFGVQETGSSLAGGSTPHMASSTPNPANPYLAMTVPETHRELVQDPVDWSLAYRRYLPPMGHGPRTVNVPQSHSQASMIGTISTQESSGVRRGKGRFQDTQTSLLDEEERGLGYPRETSPHIFSSDRRGPPRGSSQLVAAILSTDKSEKTRIHPCVIRDQAHSIFSGSNHQSPRPQTQRRSPWLQRSGISKPETRERILSMTIAVVCCLIPLFTFMYAYGLLDKLMFHLSNGEFEHFRRQDKKAVAACGWILLSLIIVAAPLIAVLLSSHSI